MGFPRQKYWNGLPFPSPEDLPNLGNLCILPLLHCRQILYHWAAREDGTLVPGTWKLKVESLSCVWLFATPWTVAYLALPSMGFSRQEYWVGCHFLLQGIFPAQRSNPGLLHCRQVLYHLSLVYNCCLMWIRVYGMKTRTLSMGIRSRFFVAAVSSAIPHLPCLLCSRDQNEGFRAFVIVIGRKCGGGGCCLLSSFPNYTLWSSVSTNVCIAKHRSFLSFIKQIFVCPLYARHCCLYQVYFCSESLRSPMANSFTH